MRTLLAISQISTLALDLVDRVLEVFNVGHVCGGDPTRIRGSGGAEGEGAHGRDGGKNGGVYDPRGGEEAEPLVNENEYRREVNVGDAQSDDADGQRERETTLLRFLRHGGGTGV